MLSLVFTPLIQTTITVLYDIVNGGSFNYLKNDGGSLSLPDIVLKLEAKSIIRLKTGQTKGSLSSYELTQSIHMITLLDVLEAMEERIDYDSLIPEVANHFKGHITSDTKAIKRIILSYLETIKLADLGKKQYLINQLSINEK